MHSVLILASQSPQRRTLLEGLGIPFAVVPSSVNERSVAESDPVRRAWVLAELKARDVAAMPQGKGKWILGCDTLVVARSGKILEKPADEGQTRDMLSVQSGGTSLVHSGLTLRSPEGQEWTRVSTSAVSFKPLTAAEIEWWVRGGMWKGRSGGFQIDGLGQLMIEKIEGDWTSIVGLPVFLLGELMHKAQAPFHPFRFA